MGRQRIDWITPIVFEDPPISYPYDSLSEKGYLFLMSDEDDCSSLGIDATKDCHYFSALCSGKVACWFICEDN